MATPFTLAFIPVARVFKFKPKFRRVLFGATFFSGALCAGGLIKSISESPEFEIQEKAWKLQRNFNQTYYEDWTFAGSLGGFLLYSLAGARFGALMSGIVLGGGAGFAFSLGVMKGAEYAYIDGDLVNFFNISGDLSN